MALARLGPLQSGSNGSTDTGALLLGLFALMFAVVGLYYVYKGATNLRRGGQVVTGDPIDAGDLDLAEGAVELEGTARPRGETVSAWYTDTDAIAYRYERKEKRHSSGEGASWQTVREGQVAVPFDVEDETGCAPVDPEDADLSLDLENTGGGSGTKKLEGRLEPGSTVYVNGVKREVTAREGPLADAYEAVGGGEDMVVADTTETWTAARYGARGVGQVVIGLVLAGVGAAMGAVALGVPLSVFEGPFA